MVLSKPLYIVLLAIACLICLPVAHAESRLALVIGNGAYAEMPLRNPVNDARAIAAKLGGLGFAVTRVENLKRDDISRTLRQFTGGIRPGDDVVVFYAGHGVQVKGTNYLPAVDARIEDEADVPLNSLNLNDLLDRLDEARAKVKIVLLDACRNNPYARHVRSAERGLARVANAPSGTLIHYATRPGKVAADGKGSNGLYTSQLLRSLDQPGQPVELLFKQVASDVRRESGGEQEPWLEGNLEGVFMFNMQAGTQVASLKPEPARPAPAPVHAPAPRSEEIKPGRSFKDCPECPEMVVIPAGSFEMGSNDGEPNEKPVHAVRIAKPFALAKTEVTVAEFRAFVRATGHRSDAERNADGKNGCYGWGSDGKADWRSGQYWSNPGFSQDALHPATCLSWKDAKAYVAWLALRTGKGYRLPSEAEWEYAARAGMTTARVWGKSADKACGWANVADQSARSQISGASDWKIYNCSDSHAYTAPVGSYRPNAFGLHDMLGNVWEWTEDCWNDSYNGAPTDGGPWTSGDCAKRVLRGGSWYPSLLLRAWSGNISRTHTFGFRPARMLP